MSYFCTMPTTQDSIQVKTVIPYPKNAKTKEYDTTPVVTHRETLEAIPLYTPSKDNVLVTSASIIFGLVLLMILYTKSSRGKVRIFYQYLNLEKYEEGQAFAELFSILQHSLTFLVFSSLIYYFLITHSSYSGWEAFAYSAIALTFFITIRITLLAITGYFINNSKIVIRHHRIIRFFSKLFGFITFPLVLICLYYPQEAYNIIFISISSVITIKLLFQLFFVYKLLRSRKFLVIHSFLYLCTLELLPIVYTVITVFFLMNNN